LKLISETGMIGLGMLLLVKPNLRSG